VYSSIAVIVCRGLEDATGEIGEQKLSVADSSSVTSSWYVPAWPFILMRRECGSR
jgi:hypothetical protein